MRKSRLPLRRTLRALTALTLVAGLILAGCAALVAAPTPTLTPPTLSPAPTSSPTITRVPTLTPYPTVARQPARPWPTPRFTPVTAVPEALNGIQISPEVRLLVLMGSDQPAPFAGRSESIMLVFYHPRLVKAAVLSIPPDLLVNIPGYTMQRLSSAYSVGGFDGLADTIQFNFGVRPQEFLLVNSDAFAGFIEQLGGLQVTLLRDYPEACNGIPAGLVDLSPEQVRCYVSFRLRNNELDRMLRQQEILQQLFQRVVGGGDVVRVPGWYNAYRNHVQTNLSAGDVTGAIPLLLRLADPGRIGYFTLSGEALRSWNLPTTLGPMVFLPVEAGVRSKIQEVVDYVSQPAPFTDTVLTLEYMLTVSPTASMTPIPSSTPTETPAPTGTPVPSETPTPTDTLTPSLTPSETGYVTRTPTPG